MDDVDCGDGKSCPKPLVCGAAGGCGPNAERYQPGAVNEPPKQPFHPDPPPPNDKTLLGVISIVLAVVLAYIAHGLPRPAKIGIAVLASVIVGIYKYHAGDGHVWEIASLPLGFGFVLTLIWALSGD